MKFGRKVFFVFLLSGLGGIFLQNTFFDILTSLIFGILGLLVFCQRCLYTRQGYSIGIIFCVGILFGIGISFMSTSQVVLNTLYLKPYYMESSIEMKSTIMDIYRQNEFDTDVTVQVKNIGKQDVLNRDIFAIVRIPNNYDVAPGDNLTTQNRLYKIQDFGDSNIRQYYESKGIYFRVYPYNISLEKSQKISPYARVKSSLVGKIESLYPEVTSGFLAGILLGERSTFSPELREDFNRSGLSHIVAVSGFNITILVLFCGYMFFFFPRVIQIILGIASITLFVLLVGPSAPVLRAAIMGGIGYIALSSGRNADSLMLLVFSLFCICLFSPLSLNYDISLHLSFFAVLGIILFSDMFKKLFFFAPEAFFIRESLVMTMSALILNIPILITNFGQISVVAPLTNILVVWNIPLLMLFGFISICFSYFFSLGSYIFAYLTYLLLSFNLWVVEYFGSKSWSIVEIGAGEWKWYVIGGGYIFILSLYFLLKTYWPQLKNH